MARSLRSKIRQFLTQAIALLWAIACVLCLMPVHAAQHPLPQTLAQWSDRSGDYFDRVEKTAPGYLIWSRFPVEVYVQPGDQRSQAWTKAMLQAVNEWSVYLPLQLVEQRDNADIIVDRSSIPIRFPPIKRVRFADTRFALYTNSVLRHRMTVRIQPNQPDLSLLAAARHELGHALGIWGHSTQETDVMYFSQVRTPPRISARDVNTLKRVYEQPTQLGWK